MIAHVTDVGHEIFPEGPLHNEIPAFDIATPEVLRDGIGGTGDGERCETGRVVRCDLGGVRDTVGEIHGRIA
ncbi:MAG: hypothetical protein WAK27_16195, partial [Candidatus Sulfotelmatobacter sp.]